jgi:nucleotidyltransferase substrate binding protein (TIGR01987 family)
MGENARRTEVRQNRGSPLPGKRCQAPFGVSTKGCITHILKTVKKMDADIRWKQRFQNYKKALVTVKNAVELAASRELTDLEKQGTIQGFEFTFELAWNVMKDYLEEQGITDIIGSKNAIRHAFNIGLIKDGQVWMDMVEDRNLAAHVYDEKTAEDLVTAIINTYYFQFNSLAETMNGLE